MMGEGGSGRQTGDGCEQACYDRLRWGRRGRVRPGWSQAWGDDEVAVVPPVRPEVVPNPPEAETIPLPMISQMLQKYVPGDVLGALRAEERSLGLVADPPPS